MKREIIIDGSASDWFEKATFVLKDSKPNNIPKDLTSYAEEIIENHMKKSPDFTTKAAPVYEQAQKAYHDHAKREYERLNKEKEVLRKRAKHVNTFVAISLIACILSLIALAFSSLG